MIQLLLLSGGGDEVTAPDGAASDFLGFTTQHAGDVDGDGFDDLIVGAYGSDDHAPEAGSVVLVLGAATGVGDLQRTVADDTGTGDRLGWAVGAGADVDGDGFDDVLGGAPNDDDQAPNSGSAFLWPGSAAGLGSTPTKLLQANGAEDDALGSALALGDVDGDGHADALVTAPGSGGYVGSLHVFSAGQDERRVEASDGAAGDFFGVSMDHVGDVDGDGYGDVVVGAWADDDGGEQSGSAYLFLGSADGLVEADKLAGRAAYDWLGVSVAGAGDVDADGLDDVVVGAYATDGSGSASGSAFVVLGAVTGFGAATEIVAPDGAAEDGFGGAVSGAGDLDADGFADLVVGASGVDGPGLDAGAAYVFYGSGAGIDPAGQRLSPPVAEGDQLGRSVAGGGDLNGDGYADLALGRWKADAGAEDAGALVVSYGGCRLQLWFLDMDGDGYGGQDTAFTCDAPDGYVATDGDCDDGDDAVHPGAEDAPEDGIDQDCDGQDAARQDSPPQDSDEPPDSDPPPDSQPADSEPPTESDPPDEPPVVEPEPRCGCTTGPSPGLLAGLLVLLGIRRSARATGAWTEPR